MKLRHAKTIAILLTLAGLAAFFGLAFLLFIPTFKENLKLGSDINDAFGQLDAQYAHRKNLLVSHARVTAARDTMKRLATEFVPTGHELDLITSIETLAANDGVEERVQLNENENGGPTPELKERYDLTLSGPYRNVLQMLVDLEKMPEMLMTDGMEARASTNEAGQSQLLITMHGAISTPPPGVAL